MVIVDATVVGGRERAVKDVRCVWGGGEERVCVGGGVCVWEVYMCEGGGGLCVCVGGKEMRCMCEGGGGKEGLSDKSLRTSCLYHRTCC